MSSTVVLIPDQTYGHLAMFRQIVGALVQLSQTDGVVTKVVAAGEAHSIADPSLLPPELREQVELREIEYRAIAHPDYCNGYDQPAFVSPVYAMPFDHGYSLSDCDIWISLAPYWGSNNLPFAPVRPYLAYASWFPERDKATTAPSDLSHIYHASRLSYFKYLRGARRVLVTSQQRAIDVTTIAGVLPERVVLLPFAYDPLPSPPPNAEAREKREILWITDSHRDSTWQRGMEILQAYRNTHDHDRSVTLCGSPREVDHHATGRSVDPSDDFWSSIPAQLAGAGMDNVTFTAVDTVDQFVQKLAGAALVFHNRETGPVPPVLIDAGRAGIPVVTSDYAGAREAVDLGGASACFFDASSAASDVAELINDQINAPKRSVDATLRSQDLARTDCATTLKQDIF